MNTRVFVGVVLALSFLVTAPAWATTRYVDATAGTCSGNYSIANRNCTGSDGNSYATIAAGVSATASGDTLNIRTGTYNATMSNTITGGISAASPTIIQGYNAEIFTLAATSGVQTIYLLNDPYVTLRRFIIDGGAGTSNNPIKIESSVGIVIEDCEIKNGVFSGLLVTSGSNNGVVRRCNIHNNGSTSLSHGIYLGSGTGASGWLIERNSIHDNSGFCMQAYPIAPNNTVRYNEFYGCTTGVIMYKTGNIFEHNIVRNNSADGIATPSDSSGTIIRHNSVYANGNRGIWVRPSSNNHVLQNNISIGNATNLVNEGAGTTLTTNLTSGTATNIWTNPAAGDLTLKAGSAAINGGTNIGLVFNGSAPDQGAFETIKHPTQAGCVVADGAASTLKITFDNNVFPPLLPATGIAFGTNAFTSRKLGSNNPVTAAIRVGDNRIDLTLQNAIVGGDTVDYSYSTTSGNVTDSALVGNSFNQPLHAITNQSCTNNVSGGGGVGVRTQTVFRFNGLRGTEASPVATPYAAAPENTNIFVIPGGSVRLRLGVSCTSFDCPPIGLFPFYSRNGGAYTLTPDTFTSDNIGFCGTSPDVDIPTSGTATTQQLSGSGTFVPGALIRASNAIPTIDMAVSNRTELEYCFTFDTDVTPGTDNYQFRLYDQNNLPLDGYTVTPRATISSAQMGSGF